MDKHGVEHGASHGRCADGGRPASAATQRGIAREQRVRQIHPPLAVYGNHGTCGLVVTCLTARFTGNAVVVWRVRSGGYDYRLDYVGTARIAFNAIGGAAFGFGVAWLIGPSHAVGGSIAALGGGLLGFAMLGLLNRPFSEAEWGIL